MPGGAWYGCVKDERGDWSFGPTTLARAQRAVEAYLEHEDFQKQESEKSWRTPRSASASTTRSAPRVVTTAA